MKVAFPLINERELALDFSKSTIIGIFDEENERLEFIQLESEFQNKGGSVLMDLQQVKDLTTIVSPSLSFMALRVFKEHQFETFKADGTSLLENIILFKERTLKPFMSAGSFLEAMCGGGCSSCASSESCN